MTSTSGDRFAEEKKVSREDLITKYEEMWAMSLVPSDSSRVNETKEGEKMSGEEKKMTREDLITKYEEVIESIYDEQTAGVYTWRGVLLAFLWEYDELTQVKKPVGGPVYRGVE